MGYGALDLGYIGLIMNSAGTLGGIISSILMENQLSIGGAPKYDIFLKFFIYLILLSRNYIIVNMNFRGLEILPIILFILFILF